LRNKGPRRARTEKQDPPWPKKENHFPVNGGLLRHLARGSLPSEYPRKNKREEIVVDGGTVEKNGNSDPICAIGKGGPGRKQRGGVYLNSPGKVYNCTFPGPREGFRERGGVRYPGVTFHLRIPLRKISGERKSGVPFQLLTWVSS